jgi:hypothetical protein
MKKASKKFQEGESYTILEQYSLKFSRLSKKRNPEKFTAKRNFRKYNN